MKHMIFILFVLLTLTACQQHASSNPENSPAETSPEEIPAVQPTTPANPGWVPCDQLKPKEPENSGSGSNTGSGNSGSTTNPVVQPTQPSEPTVYLPTTFGVYTLNRGKYTKYVNEYKGSKFYNLFALYDAAYEKDYSGKFKTFNVEEPNYGMYYQYPSKFYYNDKLVQFVVAVKHKKDSHFDIYYAVKNGDQYDLLKRGVSEFELQVETFNFGGDSRSRSWSAYANALDPMADVLRAWSIETGLSAYQLHQKLTEYCK